jgi:hypothetical protein
MALKPALELGTQETSMAATKPARAHLPPPRLVVSPEAARTKIDAQIAAGQTMLEAQILSFSMLMKARMERREWSSNNRQILADLFDNASVADAYGAILADTVSDRPDMMGKISEHRQAVRRSIEKLRAISDLLDRLTA